MGSHRFRLVQAPMMGIVGVLLLLFYNNCGVMTETIYEKASGSESSIGKLNSIDFLKSPRPTLIQGQAGYAYILAEYIKPQCGSCHMAGTSNGVPMAADDIGLAYGSAYNVTREKFLQSVTKNIFCGPACNLSPDGEVYKAVVEWLDHKQ